MKYDEIRDQLQSLLPGRSDENGATRRTALPSTRAASNMLRAFQIVTGSPVSRCSTDSSWRISRTDCVIDRLPADSITMKRSPGRS